MKHLFLITINPVQSFIEQARKVHDLAAGSDMLSFFMEGIADFIKTNQHFERQISPSESTKAYPHRLLFSLNTDNVQEIKNVGSEIEKQFQIILNQKIDDYLKILNSDSFEIAQKQIHRIFKLYWVALDYKENNFKVKYNEIDKLLGSVKNIRPFEQFEEKGRKCSLNGEYNVVVYRYKDDKEEQKDKDLIRSQVKNHKGEQKRVVKWLEYTSNITCIGENSRVDLRKLSHGEALSGISFLKRNWELKDKKGFDATCEIAYLDAVKKLTESKNVIKKLQDIDEQYLYEDAFPSKSEFEKKHKEKYADAKIYLSLIKTELKSKNLKLGKYYAILMFDADTMGKWLSDDKKLNDNVDLKVFQDKLSGKLVDFADEATKYVNGKNETDKKGQVIYAGGDDYLALIGLEYLFDVLIHLRKRFNEIINCDKLNELKKDKKEEITFSAGIAIAHYKTPLSFVLGEARKAEHTAKEEGDRNAFAITVLKRSGEIKQAYQKFGDDSKNNKNLELLQNLLEYRQSGTVTRTFINNFAAEFKPLIEDGKTKNLLNAAVKKEFVRLLFKATENTSKLKENFKKDLFALSKVYKNEMANVKYDNFIDILLIIDFISREINKPVKN